MGPSDSLCCEIGSFSCHHHPFRFLKPEVLWLYFRMLELWFSRSVSLPHCSSLFICMWIWDHLVHQLLNLAAWPVYPNCLFPCLLSVWINVSSLTPWLSDFFTVQFSGSSGCFCFYIVCCPFGCVRKWSMSTYSSILAGTRKLLLNHFSYSSL